MKRLLYLLCGVPGSGKTWVLRQLSNKFMCIEHDDYIDKKVSLVDGVNVWAEEEPKKPLLLDCPFGERELRTKLEKAGYDVKPIFIVEPTAVVQERYLKREGKPLARASVTRSVTIMQRANEWNAPRGTADQVLELLKKEAA